MLSLFHFQVEYILVKFDDKNKVARVSLRAQELLAILNQREADNPTGETNVQLTILFAYINQTKLALIH